jgi:hypothetical protein
MDSQRQDQPNEDRAAPEESRGGPMNYSDADSGDLVPACSAVRICQQDAGCEVQRFIIAFTVMTNPN